MEDSKSDFGKGRFFFSPAGIVLIIMLAIASFYLITEHRAHLYGALPWLLLLACPLIHLFMHHGHGDRSGSQDSSDDRGTSSRHNH
jgi:hypothetical protein